MGRLKLISSVICLLLSVYAYSQNASLLDSIITVQFTQNTFQGHIDNLAVQHDIIVSFNGSRMEGDKIITLPSNSLPINEIISQLFINEKIRLTLNNNKILITFLEEPEAKFRTIRGYIRDKASGEALVGASVIDLNSFLSTFSNEVGFYSLTIPIENSLINVNYLGYKDVTMDNIQNSKVDIALEFDNELSTIIISDVGGNFRIGNGAEWIEMEDTKGFTTVSGENDLLFNLRTNPGVQSGNEGQSGLLVRGGSVDQNLYLLDGVPLYEVSHTAGFSSMFIDETIKNAELIKNGFPARYGGRLSSVVDIQLKDGHNKEYKGNIQASLPGLKGHLEGPLFGESTTFNIGGRKSYFDQYLPDLLKDVIDFDDIGLSYYDLVGKLTHRFTPSLKASLSFYDGGDEIFINRSNYEIDGESSFSTTNRDQLGWGSSTYNFNLTNILNDKLLLNLNIGSVRYNYNARGTYSFEAVDGDLPSLQEVDVVSKSEILDYIFGVNFDYYYNDQHRLKFGANYLRHRYNPGVRQSREINNGVIDSFIDVDNFIFADETSFYLEDTYTPNEELQFYAGLHLASFSTNGTNYRSFQPRLNVVYSPTDNDRISGSYTKMTQFVHLLINSGIGLPSDLWVPSTAEIEPQHSDQISISYSRLLGYGFELGLEGYIKWMSNLVDFNQPANLFFTVVNGNEPPILREPEDWESNTVSGDGFARGVELSLARRKGKFTGWFSYSLALSTRTFVSLNEGETFPYRYDRRHDMNVGLMYKVNRNLSLSTNFVAGNGNAFSLALEGFDSIFGLTLLNSDDRNNYRYPFFHHLDVQLNYNHLFKNSTALEVSFGLYNVYNRKNAYYIYIVNNNLRTDPVAHKTSIFPILPNLSVNYIF